MHAKFGNRAQTGLRRCWGLMTDGRIQFSRPAQGASGTSSFALDTGAQQALLREEFRLHQCVELKGFLQASLLEVISVQLRGAEFLAERHGVGSSGALPPNSAANALLLLLMNDPDLFDALAAITAAGPIASFVGRVYRLESGREQSLDWHNDLGDDRRRLALSVNLGEEAYTGGILQLRDARTGRMLREAKPASQGDALLFRIASHLEHRVTPVEGQASRTVYSGWFRAGGSIFGAQR